MSARRKLRKTVRWARYVNHYWHIPGATVGGWAAYRVICEGLEGRRWRHIRRQAKHRFGETS